MALLVAPALALPSFSDSNTPDQLYSEVATSYGRVLAIEKEGGNVTGVVQQLNLALSLVGEGESAQPNDSAQAQAAYQQAEALIQSANQELPAVEQQGKAASQSQLIWLALSLIALAAAGAGVYLFGGRVFWSLWIRAHRGWAIRKT